MASISKVSYQTANFFKKSIWTGSALIRASTCKHSLNWLIYFTNFKGQLKDKQKFILKFGTNFDPDQIDHHYHKLVEIWIINV